MIELPEAITLAKQLAAETSGLTVVSVSPPTKPHKFCFFSGDPALYGDALIGATVTAAEGFGIYAELVFDIGRRLSINDGVNPRLLTAPPKDYQLCVGLSDGRVLAFTVAMYGFINLHGDDYADEYYMKSRGYVSPLSDGFDARFAEVLTAAKPSDSVKAFLATGQKFPGVGNGVLQDILFNAGINPRRKILSLSAAELDALRESVKSTLRLMIERGGRDTEKDIYGNIGGYKTILSKNTHKNGCPKCGGAITKEAYMGGAVYYCAFCQISR